MLKNHLKIAWRSLRRRPVYTLINVLGLAVGMAACLLIGLWVQYELSYDRFHEKAGRIYRVTLEQHSEDQTVRRAVTQPALAPALKRDFSAVREAVRLTGPREAYVEMGEQRFKEDHLTFADSAFFRVFSFPFVRGNPETALADPNGVVLTRSAARRYFGEKDPVGHPLEVTSGSDTFDLTVTGVVQDVPSNAHFTFDLVASRAAFASEVPGAGDDMWWLFGDYTYILLPEDYDASRLAEQLPVFAERHLEERRGTTLGFELQPLTSIHLHSHLESEFAPNGHLAYVRALGAVGLFILLIACINFMNLATARSTERAREVGVRKTVGAHREQLVRQFLAESVLLALLAGLLGLALAELNLPFFEQLLDQELTSGSAQFGWLLFGMLALTLLAGLLAGSYPAFYLSAFRPVPVLKDALPKRSTSRSALVRKGLVVTQFALTIGLLIGTGTVYEQIAYVQSKNLGFDKEHVVVLPNAPALQDRGKKAAKRELSRHPGIESVAAASRIPTQMEFTNGEVIPEGARRSYPVMWNPVDPSYVPTLNIQMVKGRNFSEALASDSSAFLVNETAARRFGWTEPLGKTIRSPATEEVMGRVIGVVEDFHLQSLHQTIAPGVFLLGSPGTLDNYVVRLRPGDASGALSFLEETWNQFVPDQPFEYYFLDAQYDALYRAEQRFGRLIGAFSGLAILIACLGLFGLAAYAAERRTKEIGIRKVLGASVPSIVALLSKDFLKLVLLAFVIAAPIAYYVMNRWLKSFAYRIELGLGTLLLAGLLAAAIAFATVSHQAVKAALTDPVESLRYE